MERYARLHASSLTVLHDHLARSGGCSIFLGGGLILNIQIIQDAKMPIFNYSVAFLCIVYRSSSFLGG